MFAKVELCLIVLHNENCKLIPPNSNTRWVLGFNKCGPDKTNVTYCK